MTFRTILSNNGVFILFLVQGKSARMADYFAHKTHCNYLINCAIQSKKNKPSVQDKVLYGPHLVEEIS